MSLSDLASLGSFVSGVFVIVTLVLLLLQMRESNRNQRALMQQGRSMRTAATLAIQTDRYLSEVITQIEQGDASLRDADARAFTVFSYRVLVDIEDSYLQHGLGVLKADSWGSDLARLSVIARQPHHRAAWRQVRAYFDAGFRNFVDEIFNQPSAARPTSVGATFKVHLAEELARAT